ncbi:hypothetical protein [Mucilaginibacter sp. UR6-11]|uniref:hypothetical protein n=1 Tax=Mucilaginibacter sp. UR6-11 TaxID=1435644 RepID=UPI001E3E6BB9|nr:hypothetical protein [Mucilaginibacter sp. UR6-11]MCC8426395.1 hypothetical protein [Mucilaginibacter sp. UR6-11]
MIKKSITEPSSVHKHQLETEFPLSEKDEQGRCMERMRELQNEALKLWRSLKKKKQK